MSCTQIEGNWEIVSTSSPTFGPFVVGNSVDITADTNTYNVNVFQGTALQAEYKNFTCVATDSISGQVEWGNDRANMTITRAASGDKRVDAGWTQISAAQTPQTVGTWVGNDSGQEERP